MKNLLGIIRNLHKYTFSPYCYLLSFLPYFIYLSISFSLYPTISIYYTLYFWVSLSLYYDNLLLISISLFDVKLYPLSLLWRVSNLFSDFGYTMRSSSFLIGLIYFLYVLNCLDLLVLGNSTPFPLTDQPVLNRGVICMIINYNKDY